MSQLCNLAKCNRTSRGLCDCCKQNLCLQHLTEHNVALLSQISPLTDTINTLGERLQILYTEGITANCCLKLEHWRVECHQKIDRFFERQCRQVNDLIDTKVRLQKEEIDRVRTKVAEIVREQEITQKDLDSLVSTVRYLEAAINKIEQTTLQINFRGFELDEESINISEKNSSEIDISKVFNNCKTFNSANGSYSVLACNEQYLLIHTNPNLCLVNRDMKVVKQILWTYDKIYDMCWSATLDKFILIEKYNIYIVEKDISSIEVGQMIEKYKWLACTCSDTCLFLLVDTSPPWIGCYSISSSMELIQKWQVFEKSSTDIVDDIVYRHGMLAMMVQNTQNTDVRIELRSVETLTCVWSLALGIFSINESIFRCCAITCNEWIVVDHKNNHLVHVTADGKIKNTIAYHSTPRRAILFEPNLLVVITRTGIQFHQL
ncbi:unnamed protein product [Adineta ricciae]|nr:unnamed protein product [Adineta ricciae]